MTNHTSKDRPSIRVASAPRELLTSSIPNELSFPRRAKWPWEFCRMGIHAGSIGPGEVTPDHFISSTNSTSIVGTSISQVILQEFSGLSSKPEMFDLHLEKFACRANSEIGEIGGSRHTRLGAHRAEPYFGGQASPRAITLAYHWIFGSQGPMPPLKLPTFCPQKMTDRSKLTCLPLVTPESHNIQEAVASNQILAFPTFPLSAVGPKL